MVNLYIRRRKKLVKVYARRRRGFIDGLQKPSTPLFSKEIAAQKEQALNNGLFYGVKDFINTDFVEGTPEPCTFEKDLVYTRRRRFIDGKQQQCLPLSSREEVQNNELVSSVKDLRDIGFVEGTPGNPEVEFESHASVISSKPGDDIVLNTRTNLPENVPDNAKIPSGNRKISNVNLLSILQQLTSTLSLQRRPRSARKAASPASRRQGTIEFAASNTSKRMASFFGASASTSVYCGIIPKTPIKKDKKSKFASKSVCLNVPSLLSTGLLEGAFVKYMKDNLELKGTLTASGICCGCSLCNFKQVVSSLNFEKHAGSKSNNHNDHIFFENGKSLYGLAKELKNVSLGSLGELIEEKIGYQANIDYNAWKDSISAVDIESSSIRKITHIEQHDKIHLEENELDENIIMAHIKSCHEAVEGKPKMDKSKGGGKNQKQFSDLFHEVQASLNFPKGPRSARGERSSLSVISKVNQKPSRKLIFSDDDPQHPPAHKKMGLDLIPSKESVSLMESSEYQAKVGDSLLQNPKNIHSPAPIRKKEVNMSNMYTPDTPLSSVSHLLATGLLEGLLVNYKKDEIELRGLIKDLGIYCGCSSCHFSKVLSLLNFEKHGGSSSPNQNECIFVNDKITLCALVEELWGVPLGLLSGEVIEKIIGCQPNMKCFLSWKESFDKKESKLQQASIVDGKNKLTDVLLHQKNSSDERLPTSEDNLSLSSRNVTKFNFSRLPTSEDNLSLSSRNVTKFNFSRQARQTTKHREQDFHQQIFDLLDDGSKLSYRSHGEEVLTGYKSGKNILCTCCNVLVAPSKFEAHAGHERKRKPYHSIYTSYGKSLHQIAMFLLHDKSVESSNTNHIMAYMAGGDSPLISRYTHAYNAGEPCPSVCYMGRKFLAPCNSGSCVLCSDGDATLNFGNICDSTMLFCGQCGRMFHVGCLRHHGICNIEKRPCPPDIWLCGNNCRNVRADLLDFVQRGPRTVPESLLNSSKSSFAESTSLEETEIDVHWQLLSGRFQGDESKSLLEQATKIFQEAFYAVYKGHRDVLSTMVKGERGVAEFFGGMLCAVITVKSIIVSAALLRVFGNHVAELPLVVTSKERKQEGYFKILFLKIEEMLSIMKVENLILPADDDSLPMWLEKFGFAKLNKNEILEYRMKHRIVMFEKTTLLKKAVPSTIHR